jgi:hypothetical protein
MRVLRRCVSRNAILAYGAAQDDLATLRASAPTTTIVDELIARRAERCGGATGG